MLGRVPHVVGVMGDRGCDRYLIDYQYIEVGDVVIVSYMRTRTLSGMSPRLFSYEVNRILCAGVHACCHCERRF